MLTEPLHNEKEILHLAAEGDEAAFTAIFNHYQGWTNAIAFMLTRSEAAAEELVQDIFLKIWLRRTNLREVEYFQDYLFIITRNQAYTALKRQANQRKLHLQAAENMTVIDLGTDQKLMEKDFLRLVEEAIDRLPLQQRQVYRLSRDMGLSRDQIAEKLKVSPNTVKTHMSQAIKNIRAYCIAHLDPLSAILLMGYVVYEAAVN